MEVRERLRDGGAAVVQEPYQLGGGDMPEMTIATSADPDDNYFQLVSPI
jgi:predicted enzyme related to lactoylglutathione lyase